MRSLRLVAAKARDINHNFLSESSLGQLSANLGLPE
jgi:hypothetical protein